MGEELIGEYLLWNLNENKQYLYRKRYALGAPDSPISSYEALLRGIGRSIGAIGNRGDIFDRTRAAKKFITDYRSGKLGKMTLDPLSRPLSEEI